MQYFVVLTKECNLLCSYCGGGSDTPPKEVKYSIDDLKSFISKDPDPFIEFYGGEPLLRLKAMAEMMDALPGKFGVQTNGIFLDRVEPRLLQKIEVILVSVDGPKETTDPRRGDGVYDRVVGNVRKARRAGFSGDLVARMTVTQGSDIRENVLHLLRTELFDHVHWQLDFAMFWEAGELTEPGFEDWIDEYNLGITYLVRWWVDEIRRSGRVPGLVPFTGVMGSLLRGTPSRLRCGSGIDFFAIEPSGRVSACPVSVDYSFSAIGSLQRSDPEQLRDMAVVGEPCTSCSVYSICGGRCLFVNHSQQMLRKGGYAQICKTVKHMIGELQGVRDEVNGLIREGVVDAGDFAYPEFGNGCEVIP